MCDITVYSAEGQDDTIQKNILITPSFVSLVLISAFVSLSVVFLAVFLSCGFSNLPSCTDNGS